MPSLRAGDEAATSKIRQLNFPNEATGGILQLSKKAADDVNFGHRYVLKVLRYFEKN